MFNMRTFAGLFSICVIGLGCGGSAFSQSYPNKPIRIVTGGAGGGGDIVARLIAGGISGPLGQPVIVDNRATGFVPGDVVAKSPPDGYTLLLFGVTFYLQTLLTKGAPYDPIRDFAPVTLVSIDPAIVVVHPSLPARSIKELIALAKARPGELNYASGPNASTSHLGMELLRSMTGINMVRIPYKSTSQQLTEVIGGQVQLTWTSINVALPQIKSGKLRALAITSTQESALFPGLPTVAETLPGYELVSINGIWAPAKTPDPPITRLNQEIVRFLKTKEAKETLLANGQDIVGDSPEEFGAWLKADLAKWKKILDDAGIKPE